MRKVLIVSRTKMKSGVCVGGIDIASGSFVRLHTEYGANLPSDAPYNIGEIWNLDLETPWNPRKPPHVEDVMVKSASCSEIVPSETLSSFIKELGVSVCCGSLESLFEGKVAFTSRGKGYINESNIPCNSVCFWIPDKDLYPSDSFGKVNYVYGDKQIPYVGFQKVDVIPAGTLVRMSLANWWKPDDADVEPRCYVQLSGWY